MIEKKPFLNLDKLLNPGACFEFQGKRYDIKPIEVGVYMSFCNAYLEFKKAIEEKKATSKDSKDIIFGVINSVCPEFTIDVLEKMTLYQSGMVIQLIFDIFKPDDLDEDEIKKKVFAYLPVEKNSQT